MFANAGPSGEPIATPSVYLYYEVSTYSMLSAIFKQEGDGDDFLVTLNRLHPALKFTFEK